MNEITSKKLKDDNIFSFIILIFSNFGNFSSLIFLMYMSRNLNDNYFSLNSSLIGAVSLLTIFATFLTPYLSKIVSKFSSYKLKHFYLKNIFIISLIAVIPLILVLIFKENIYNYFSFKNNKILLILYFVFYFNVLMFYNDGFILGHNKYLAHSLLFLIQQVSKLFFLIGIIYFYFSNYAGIYSIFFSFLFMISLMTIYILRIDSQKKEKKTLKFNLKIFKKDFLSVFFLQIIILFLLNIDIVLSRNIFSNYVSSQYIVISSLSKIIFYFFGVLLPVIIPHTIFNMKKKFNEFTYIYKVIFIISISFLFVIFCEKYFLEFILKEVFNRENDLEFLFLKLCSAFVLLSMNAFLLNFFYSIKKKNCINLSFIILFISTFFLNKINSPLSLSNYLFYTNLLCFIILLFYFLKYNLKKKFTSSIY